MECEGGAHPEGVALGGVERGADVEPVDEGVLCDALVELDEGLALREVALDDASDYYRGFRAAYSSPCHRSFLVALAYLDAVADVFEGIYYIRFFESDDAF